jgi:SAM-dependent methyltransferase
VSATPFYAAERSLHVEIYDEMNRVVPGGDDVAFVRELAAASGGPVLELGAGTGRVSIPLAEAGSRVVGLDRSVAMLRVAEAKRAALPPDVRRRLRFVQADMTDYALRRRFGLVFAAFRVFMSLDDVAAQRRALRLAREHLVPGGTLVIDVFDPLLDRIAPGRHPGEERGVYRHPRTGRAVHVTTVGRTTDAVDQRLVETWRFAELDEAGGVACEELEELTLRWTYRHEMRHLLERSGFEPIAEYSDYAKAPPAYGKEQIWVARKVPRR